MIYFEKPELFNGSQFVAELRNAGIDIVDTQIETHLISYRLIVTNEGKLGVETESTNKAKIQGLLNSHTPAQVATAE
tara:strand:+ start:946 stop:1176 length:231 start_codon:yes stop_codon:yes gene_type:complete